MKNIKLDKKLKSSLIKLILVTVLSENLFGWCACFYLEFPNDGSEKIMENMGILSTKITVSSLKIIPYAYLLDGAYYKVEKDHVSSVKNVNMGLLENRESLKLETKGIEQRQLRKNINCSTLGSEIALAESQILYLEQLLLEISIESNRKISNEKILLLR